MRHGFIFPGEVVGGHEMMAAKILRALKQGAKQVVIISSRTWCNLSEKILNG
jgi:hypothetical protein